MDWRIRGLLSIPSDLLFLLLALVIVLSIKEAVSRDFASVMFYEKIWFLSEIPKVLINFALPVQSLCWFEVLVLFSVRFFVFLSFLVSSSFSLFFEF